MNSILSFISLRSFSYQVFRYYSTFAFAIVHQVAASETFFHTAHSFGSSWVVGFVSCSKWAEKIPPQKAPKTQTPLASRSPGSFDLSMFDRLEVPVERGDLH